MSRLFRIYRVLLKASLIRAFEYRAQIVLWLLADAFPLVMMAVWLALVSEVGVIQGWGQADFISYYLATSVVTQITVSGLTWAWDEEVRLGDLSVKLLKPLDPLHQLVVLELMSWKVLVVALIAPLLIVLALASPLVNYTTDPLLLLLFAVTLLAALVMNVFLSSFFGMLAFWITTSRNLFSLAYGVGQFLSGYIAPMALFPQEVQNLARLLPFRSYLGLPVETLLGRLTPAEVLEGLAVTMVWTIVFFVLYRWLWFKGLRRYEGVGA